MLRENSGDGRSFQATEVLSPEAVINRVADQTRDLPVHEVYFWLSIAGMPDESVQRHLELLCGQVRPALAPLGPSSD